MRKHGQGYKKRTYTVKSIADKARLSMNTKEQYFVPMSACMLLKCL